MLINLLLWIPIFYIFAKKPPKIIGSYSAIEGILKDEKEFTNIARISEKKKKKKGDIESQIETKNEPQTESKLI
jgi:hypothetical protein